MAKLMSAAAIEQERLETLRKITNDYPIAPYTKRPAIIQARYSTVRQYTESVKEGLEQSEKLLQRAFDLGWTRELISHILVENKLTKDGRIRNVSGTIPIDDRPGMTTIVELVTMDKAGALLCDDVSRLTRDADLVDAMILAKVCKAHDCIIVTSDRVYNFRRKGDFEAYTDEARAAATWIETHIKNKMLKNRTRKAQQGKLANGVTSVGLMAVGDKRSEVVPTVHASRVNWLYARFRAHNASLNSLLYEIREMAKRGEPLFPVHSSIDPTQMFLSEVRQGDTLLGWTVSSRYGLEHILTQPMYQGHLVFNGRVIKYDAFPAAKIVDELNWRYAWEALSDVDLDGQPIERPDRVIRYTQKTSEDTGALLYGNRNDGSPVITGTDGRRVYIHRGASHGKSILIYSLHKRTWPNDTPDGYEASVTVRRLDGIIAAHLLDWIRKSEFANKLLTPCTEEPSILNLPDVVDGVANTEQPAKLPDSMLEELDGQIAETERNINIGGKYMTDAQLEAAYAKAARLRKRRTAIEQAQANRERIKQEIKQATDDLCLACDQWNAWDIERRRRLIRLTTSAITLEAVEQGHVRLMVYWAEVLGGMVERCEIVRNGNGTHQEVTWHVERMTNEFGGS